MFALAGNPTSRTNPADVKNIVRFAKCIISLFSINMSNEDNALCFVQNVCVCVCACVRVCVRACMHACTRTCVRVLCTLKHCQLLIPPKGGLQQ